MVRELDNLVERILQNESYENELQEMQQAELAGGGGFRYDEQGDAIMGGMDDEELYIEL